MRRFVIILAVLLFASVAFGASCIMGNYIPLETPVITSPLTGAACDSDAPPTFIIYEEGNEVNLMAGSLYKFDDTHTTGLYQRLIGLTDANGYEPNKNYTIYYTWDVCGVTQATKDTWQVVYDVNAYLTTLASTSTTRYNNLSNRIDQHDANDVNEHNTTQAAIASLPTTTSFLDMLLTGHDIEDSFAWYVKQGLKGKIRGK